MENNKKISLAEYIDFLTKGYTEYGGIEESTFAGKYDGIYEYCFFIERDVSKKPTEDKVNDNLEKLINYLYINMD